MEAVKKILPIVDPVIKCHQFRAYPLSVMGNHSNFVPWLIGNHIQIHCNREILDSNQCRFEFFSPLFHFETKNPIISTNVIPRNLVNSLGDTFCEFLMTVINLNYYPYFSVNERYISDRTSTDPTYQGAVLYQKIGVSHDIFIYGYDQAEKLFYYTGYDKNNIFRNSYASFEELETAFWNAEFDEWKNMFCHEDILLIKMFEDKKEDYRKFIEFKRMMIFLNDYLYSYNTSTRTGIADSCGEWEHNISDTPLSHRFGIDAHNGLLDFIDLQMNDEIGTDIRPFHLLYEHKKIMALRSEYLQQIGIIDNKYGFFEKLSHIESFSLKLKNLYMKYMLQRKKSHLQTLQEKLREMVKEEKTIITDFVEALREVPMIKEGQL